MIVELVCYLSLINTNNLLLSIPHTFNYKTFFVYFSSKTAFISKLH